MRDILDLTKEEQDKIAQFVGRKIDVILMERHSVGAFLLKSDGDIKVRYDDELDEFIEAFLINYWCDECQSYIIDEKVKMETAEMDKAMIEHVMNHLGIE